jgi:hypothetical protein
MVWEGMEWACHSRQQALLLKIDFSKAYDYIERLCILAMLQGLGFGPIFLQSVQMLFGDSYTCITINVHQSIAFGLFTLFSTGSLLCLICMF